MATFLGNFGKNWTTSLFENLVTLMALVHFLMVLIQTFLNFLCIKNKNKVQNNNFPESACSCQID